MEGGKVRLEELDRAFDLLLVLLSIIAASLFEFFYTIEPLGIASREESIKSITKRMHAFVTYAKRTTQCIS